MPGREPEAVRMSVEIGESQRFGFQDQQTEEAVTLRSWADAQRLLVIEPHGDELGQTGPRFVQHAQRCIPGVDQIGRRFGDATQCIGEGLLGPDRHYRVEQPEQLFGSGKLETTGHPREAMTQCR